jgi:hypothetical protein
MAAFGLRFGEAAIASVHNLKGQDEFELLSRHKTFEGMAANKTYTVALCNVSTKLDKSTSSKRYGTDVEQATNSNLAKGRKAKRERGPGNALKLRKRSYLWSTLSALSLSVVDAQRICTWWPIKRDR